MQEGDHDVGFVFFAGRFDVGQHLVVVLAPGHAGQVLLGLERRKKHFAIAEQSDADAVALDDPRLVGVSLVSPAAEVGQMGLLQSLALFDEGRLAEIARMVVGYREGREVFFEDGNAGGSAR